jgi:hypothetical protein
MYTLAAITTGEPCNSAGDAGKRQDAPYPDLGRDHLGRRPGVVASYAQHPKAWFVESSFGVTGQGNRGAEAEAICSK